MNVLLEEKIRAEGGGPMIRTSRMPSVTSPERFGFQSVDVFFGIVRPRLDRVVVVRGDLLQNMETGEVRVFVAREGNTVVTEAVSAGGSGE